VNLWNRRKLSVSIHALTHSEPKSTEGSPSMVKLNKNMSKNV
jgi:hypothetical protein